MAAVAYRGMCCVAIVQPTRPQGQLCCNGGCGLSRHVLCCNRAPTHGGNGAAWRLWPIEACAVLQSCNRPRRATVLHSVLWPIEACAVLQSCNRTKEATVLHRVVWPIEACAVLQSCNRTKEATVLHRVVWPIEACAVLQSCNRTKEAPVLHRVVWPIEACAALQSCNQHTGATVLHSSLVCCGQSRHVLSTLRWCYRPTRATALG
jgi:hypothetical protein